MKAFIVKTTGTAPDIGYGPGSVVFNDLGGVVITHPTPPSGINLYDPNSPQFTPDELTNSIDIRTALSNGWITVENDVGTPITVDSLTPPLIIDFKPNNVIKVGKNSAADFASIKDALDYAATQLPVEGDEWLVQVAPGTYNEDPFVVPEYAYIVSESGVTGSVTVKANNVGADLCTITGNTIIKGISFEGVTSTGYSLIKCNGGLFGLFECGFSNADIGVNISSNDPFNPAVATILFCTTLLTGPNQKINTVYKADGAYARFIGTGMLVNVPSAILPFYPGEDPVGKVFDLNNGASVFMAALSLTIFHNTPQNVIAEIKTGSTFNASASEFVGSETAIHCVAPTSRAIVTGGSFSFNTTNFKIDAVGGVISAQGTVDDIKDSVVSGGILRLNVQNLSTDSGVVRGPLQYEYPTDSFSVDVPQFYSSWSDTGIIDNVTVTKISGLDVSVQGGRGWIRDRANHTLDIEEWQTTQLTLPPSTVSYIFYNHNTKTIEYSSSIPDTNSAILIASVSTSATEVEFIHAFHYYGRSVNKELRDYLAVVHPTIHKSGLSVSINSVDNRKFDVDSGSYFDILDLVQITGGSPVTFNTFYGGDISTKATPVQIDITNYDNAGTLTAMTSGYYRADTVFVTSDGQFSVLYGTAEFSVQADAENEPPQAPPPFLSDSAAPLATLIVQQGNGIVSVVDHRPKIITSTASSGGVTDHGALAGLGDDDHPQYLLADGSRPMSGNLNLGGFDITNVTQVDGVDVSNHGSRHAPNGLDPVPAGTTPDIQPVGNFNDAGVANSFARSDHTHLLPDDFVSNAKLANMAPKTYKGRTSPTTGDPEDVPVSTLKADLALTKADVGLENVDNVQQIPLSEKGAPNGVATLDATGKVPSTQLPSYVDDVLEFADFFSFPPIGEQGKIYVALDTGKTYRWSGTAYVEISTGDVNSVFGRTGHVVAQDADYDASQVVYTPTTNTDWDVVPTRVSSAFDELASRMRAAEQTIAYFDAYDSTGGQTFTGAIVVNIDTVRQNSGDFTLNTTTGEVTVNKTGLFQVMVSVDLDVSSGNQRTTSELWVELDSGGGGNWTVVPGSWASMYNRTSGLGDNSAFSTVILNLNSGDRLRLRTQRANGSSTLVTKLEGSRIGILEVRTW